MRLTTSYTKGLAQSAKEELTRLSPLILNPVIAKSVGKMTQEHLKTYDAEHPNKLGGRRQHYYKQMAKATSWTSDEKGATVEIDGPEGARMRVFGGIIKPVNAQYLTIPNIAAAYGHKAREFTFLKVLFGYQDDGKIGPIGLYRDDRFNSSGGRKRKQPEKGKDKTVYYWLKKEITQQGSPDVLPSDAKIASTALAAIKEHLAGL